MLTLAEAGTRQAGRCAALARSRGIGAVVLACRLFVPTSATSDRRTVSGRMGRERLQRAGGGAFSLGYSSAKVHQETPTNTGQFGHLWYPEYRAFLSAGDTSQDGRLRGPFSRQQSDATSLSAGASIED